MVETQALLSQIYVRIDGADAPENLNVAIARVEVEGSLHAPGVASILLHDPGLQWVDDPLLSPGVEIEIAGSNHASEVLMFSGEIVEIEPEFGAGSMLLLIRALDRLHRLGRGRHVRSFQNVTHADLVRKIAGETGLDADSVETATVHEYVFQHNESNLEFLMRRSADIGQLIFVREDTLFCQPLEFDGTSVELEWGASLSEFRPRLTTLGQIDEVQVRGWDPDSKREVIGVAKHGRDSSRFGATGEAGVDLSASFGISTHFVEDATTLRTQAEAEQRALALADHIAGEHVEADGVCPGNPEIRPGTRLSISAVGDRFSGTYIVTRVRHVYNAEQGFVTEFSVSGHRPDSILELIRTTNLHAGGADLMIGVVTDNQDPSGIGRVKVRFPGLSSENASHWARVVAPGAGEDRGIMFLPEINDEVLVGFQQGDIQFPYVIGGLWNGLDLPPESSQSVVSNGKVERRIIRSRSGHSVVLDDSDSSGGISIEDRSGNQIRIDSVRNSLQVQFKGDVTFRVDGSTSLVTSGRLALKGDLGVSVQSSGPVEIQGVVVKLN